MATILFFTVLLIIGTVFAVGVFQFLLIAAKTPSSRTTKTIKRLAARRKSKGTTNIHTESVLQLIAKFVRINPYKRAILEDELKVAEIAKTPEMFYAGAVFAFLKFAVLGVPFLFFFPLLSLIFLILACLKFAQERQKVDAQIKAKREQIDLDLPRFVFTIVHELKNTNNVLAIFEKHKDSFSPEFKNELTITIADMRTGNYVAALQRFEGRIGSTNLSEVVRGLIETSKGVKTHVYWETLAVRFSEMQKQELRREAQKVPAKVRKLSFALLMCMMLMYGVVLMMQVIENIGVFL
ncbi:MAG: secretion protein F [Oscillospiraceae bacterium]|nr:secretion protein F [Oscillospiraceae bacterium]